MRFKDKVAVITGAASGIGKEAALRFAAEGAFVMVLDINREAAAACAAEISPDGKAEGCAADVTDFTVMTGIMNAISQKYGRIDILVNNAGITADAQLAKMTEEQFDRVVAVNQKGVFNCTKAALPHMLEKGGKIINTSSVVGIYGNFGQTNYAATKAAVIAMTKTWAKELGKKGINVNAVAPGFIITEMTKKMPENVLEAMKEKTPLRRLGTPADIANVYLFLASEEASFIHGAVISADGGLVI